MPLMFSVSMEATSFAVHFRATAMHDLGLVLFHFHLDCPSVGENQLKLSHPCKKHQTLFHHVNGHTPQSPMSLAPRDWSVAIYECHFSVFPINSRCLPEVRSILLLHVQR